MKYVALNGGLDEDYLDQLQDCSDDDDNIPDERDEEHFREANQAIIKQLTTRPGEHAHPERYHRLTKGVVADNRYQKCKDEVSPWSSARGSNR